MALLRQSIRVAGRYLRHCSTEQLPSTNGVRRKNVLIRAKPSILIKEENFSLTKYLDENKIMNPSDWNFCRDEFVKCEKFDISEASVDMMMVNICLKKKKTEMAMTYLEYIWENRGELNVSAMSTYMKIYYKHRVRLEETEKKYLLPMYDTIRKNYPVLDPTTAESCILGISQTSRWRESLELYEMIKIYNQPGSSAASALIAAAFDHDDSDIGWKYLVEHIGRSSVEHQVYITYLRYCERNFKGDRLVDEITKMFKFWGEHDVTPYLDVVNAYGDTFNGLGWVAEKTNIAEIGTCGSCSQKLHNLKLTSAEFERLANAIRERVMIGADVYRRSTPKECTRFIKFVEESKPWDIVIDGLNVSYMKKSAHKPDGLLLRTCVQKCISMKPKILVLGRKHMLHWPKLNLPYIKRNAQLFIVDNASADDPLVLYATLCSGPETMIVSRDLMRQHMFRLRDIELRRIFKYWLMTNQITPWAVRSAKGDHVVTFNDPPKYLPLAQQTQNGWHVPYTIDPSMQLPMILEPSKLWVCFRKQATKPA